MYVRGNPVNFVDPKGLCPSSDLECTWLEYAVFRQYPYIEKVPGYSNIRSNYPFKKLELQELLATPSAEVIAQGSSSNVLGLVRLFEANHFPGKNAKGRLRWILDITGSPRFLSIHFSLFLLGDSGFCEELADGKFYDEGGPWHDTDPGPTKQMGHFLTAVSLGFDPETAYDNVSFLFETHKFETSSPSEQLNYSPPVNAEEFALNLIVGHEMLGDQRHIFQAVSIPAQYNITTADARNGFLNAVEYDRQGNTTLRDEQLRAILIATDPRFASDDAIQGATRVGNSMQDMRNSVKGWRFGQETRNGPIQTRQEAANWLRREVFNPSRTR